MNSESIMPRPGQYWVAVNCGKYKSMPVRKDDTIYIVKQHEHNRFMFICHPFADDNDVMIHISQFMNGNLRYLDSGQVA